MVEAFYEADGEGFAATALTRGSWDKGSQHGGPPAALLGRAAEAELPPGFRLARITVDILRPVPIGQVVPRVEVRAGRRVARGRAVLEADGVEVMTATAMGQVEASTTIQPTGAGLATTVLHDRTGPVGTGNQSLFVAPT